MLAIHPPLRPRPRFSGFYTTDWRETDRKYGSALGPRRGWTTTVVAVWPGGGSQGQKGRGSRDSTLAFVPRVENEGVMPGALSNHQVWRRAVCMSWVECDGVEGRGGERKGSRAAGGWPFCRPLCPAPPCPPLPFPPPDRVPLPGTIAVAEEKRREEKSP